MGPCSCGHDLGYADRYCPRCGTPAAARLTNSQTLVSPDGGPGDDGPLLLSGTTKPEAAVSTSEVHAGLRGPWLIGGGFAVIALLWALFAWPKGETPIEGTVQQVEDAEDAAETTSTTRAPPTTESFVAAKDDDDDDETTEVTNEDQDYEFRIVEGSGGSPLVGERTGLALVFGGYGRDSPIELANLDTGVIHEIGMRGTPLAAIGSYLVVDTTNGVIQVVDLTDLAAEPVRIGVTVGGWTEFVAVEDDLIWVSVAGGPGLPDLQGFSVDGEQRDKMDLSSTPYFWGWSGATDLVYNSAGGIYERTGESFRRVSSGFLRASGDSVALVHQCDEQMTCESVWFDRLSWEPLPYPAPEYNLQTAQAQVVGDDRWLVETDWASERTTISDIRTGDVVRESVGLQSRPFGLIPILSLDGRWLFESDGKTETIIDLFNDREFEVELTTKLDLSGVFVSLEGTEFEG